MVKVFGALVACVLVASCGGGGGGSSTPPPPPAPSTFTIGGTVSDLTGTGLVLENNGGNPLTVNANGTIAFSTALATGSAYNVTVRTQPTGSPAQTCTVAAGSGTVGSAPVTNVAVQCRALVGRFAYVATAAQNAVAAFTIDATNGALTPVAGSPFLTTGQAPRALFTAHGGRFLYVLGDDDVAAPGPTTLRGFVVDQQTGALTAIAQLLVNLDGTFFSGGQHPNGNFVYIPVSDSSLSTNNRLRGFAIDATTGMLTSIQGSPLGIAGDEVLNSAVLSPNGANLYLASHNAAVSSPLLLTGRITRFTVDAATGALSSVQPHTMAYNWFNGLFMHPAGTHMYTRNATNQAYASRVTLDAVTGEIGTRVDIPTPLRFGFGLVIGPAGRVFFPELGGTFGAPAPGSVRGYVDVASGPITEFVGSPYQTNGTNSLAAVLDPTGRFLALTNLGTANVTVFRIDPTSGAVTHIPGSPYTPAVGTQPGSVTFDPSGRYAYLTDGLNSISSYSIDATTGVPTFVSSQLLLGSPAVVPVTILGVQ